jgi:hypothetical protein
MTTAPGLSDRADLVHALLIRRAWVPDSALLDCLELADWLGPRIRADLTPLITTAEMQARWSCTQSAASRRVSALIKHGLVEAKLQAGPGAYWEIKRVGPVA